MDAGESDSGSMTMSELVARVWSKNRGLRRGEVKTVVSLMFDEIAGTLAEGGRAELRGFGSFSVKEYRPKKARNPRTGESILVGRKFMPYFRASRGLLGRLNGWR